MSSGSNKNVEVPVKSRSSSITTEQKEIASYVNKGQDLESETTPKEQLTTEDTGLNRRSASWLLTDNRRVRSIRDLLRPDLWDSKRPNIRPSNSFRSDISESDISCSDNTHFNGFHGELSENSSLSSYESRESASDRRRESSNEEIEKNRTRKKFSNGKSEQHSSEMLTTRSLPKRKISSSSNGLPEISENNFTEMTFLPKHQIKDKNQRRSLRTDSNNNLRTPSPKRTNSEGSKPTGKPFDHFTDTSSTSSSHNGSSSSSQNGDVFDDYLRDS